MIDAVLFDWGDTLVDGVEWTDELALAGNRAGLAAIEREGLPSAEDILDNLTELEAGLDPPDSDDEVDLGAIVRATFAQLDCELGEDELETYLWGSQIDWLSREHVHPDIHALLDGLRARGLRLAIVSNCATPSRFVESALQVQGLLARVDVTIISSGVGKRKPHPAVFERALHELGVEPVQALFVGDRVREDVWGASQLGMRTAQALWCHEDESTGATPDLLAQRPLDILDFVGRA